MLGPLYRPLKADPVDCLLAAGLLNLESRPMAGSTDFVRLEPGLYSFGAGGRRLRCYIEAGRLMVQPLAEGSTQAAAMELQAFLAMAAAQ